MRRCSAASNLLPPEGHRSSPRLAAFAAKKNLGPRRVAIAGRIFLQPARSRGAVGRVWVGEIARYKARPGNMTEILKTSEYTPWVGGLDDQDWSFVKGELSQHINARREIRSGKEVCVLDPGQYVGIVVLPSGNHFEIVPKVPVENLFCARSSAPNTALSSIRLFPELFCVSQQSL